MNNLIDDADLCVKCGLCLPHCPTYNKTRNENESPRGRIALIQAWAGKQLTTSKRLLEHIDNCLLCRSCERVCPAVVPYSRMIDNFRAQTNHKRKQSLSVTLLNLVASNKTAKRFAQSGIKNYQSGHRRQIARALKLPALFKLAGIERLLPDYHESSALAPYYPAQTTVRGNVGLFTGCMSSLLDHETVLSAITVLTASGYNVYIPDRQTCCGALALHGGNQKQAEQLSAVNCQAFSTHELDAVVTVASGCGSCLQEYEQSEFAGKVTDISHFLACSGIVFERRLAPLPASVCIHTPCTLKNAMREESGTLALLKCIPELKISLLPDTLQCCGSAGSYSLDHEKIAKSLLDDLLNSAAEFRPDYLLSSNIGCALHISAGLKEKGITMEVLHPITLIARQLKSGQ